MDFPKTESNTDLACACADNFESDFLQIHHNSSWPHLLLYEDRLSRRCKLLLITSLTNAQRAEQAQKYSRYYTMLRFFKSIEGFNMGSLDLTGRHNHRYVTLQQQWAVYLADFMALSVHATKSIHEGPRGEDSNEEASVVYQFTDIVVWEDFQRRWTWCLDRDFGDLLIHTNRTLEILKKNPLPQIQRLCLVDLPTEIHDRIFLYASFDDTCILSLTCHQLREVGRRHIFKSINISFKLLADDISLDEDLRVQLSQLARQSRKTVRSRIRLLLARPDLMSKVIHLRMGDQWRASQLSTIAPEFHLSLTENRFLVPIYRSFTRILSASFSLTSIVFTNIVIHIDVIRCISHLRHLRTLELIMCSVPSAVIQSLLSGNGTKLLSTVSNLYILLDDLSVWYCLLFCPMLRTLSARTYPDAKMILAPPDAIRHGFSFSATLERLYLETSDPNDIPVFLGWFRSMATTSPLRLTHFKLFSGIGIFDLDMIELLRSIQGPLMQILVLEGLANAGFGLFDIIPEFFPALVGLTLIRRSNRQVRTRLATWPHPSWEYAKHIARFSHLQYFAWNSNIILSRPATSPLILFEQGFLDDSTPIEIWIKHGFDAFFDEDHWTALTFAAHCPSLQMFSIIIDSARPYSISRLSRTPGGINAEQLPFNIYDLYDSWDVSRTVGHWPPILPS